MGMGAWLDGTDIPSGKESSSKAGNRGTTSAATVLIGGA